MQTFTLRLAFFYRSLTGCGFLLLNPWYSAVAQREVELSLSGGVSLAQPAIKDQHLPGRQFRTVAGFNTGAALRLTVPVSWRLGVGVEQRVTGLNQTIRYGPRKSGPSIGIGDNTVHQLGLSVRLYDVWRPGPRWGLDVALTGAYAWPYRGGTYTYEGPLRSSVGPPVPTPDFPLVQVRATERAGTAIAGLEMLLRYEWGLRHSLLLTTTYQRGLRQLTQLRSTRLEYLDDSGAVQQGSLAVVSRGSYGTVQLGYGLRLGSLEANRARNTTPRYSIPDAAEDDSEALPID